ncbi:hypothetical protein JCM16303_000804 [Sporobolomyces ruberrimus]
MAPHPAGDGPPPPSTASGGTSDHALPRSTIKFDMRQPGPPSNGRTSRPIGISSIMNHLQSKPKPTTKKSPLPLPAKGLEALAAPKPAPPPPTIEEPAASTSSPHVSSLSILGRASNKETTVGQEDPGSNGKESEGKDETSNSQGIAIVGTSTLSTSAAPPPPTLPPTPTETSATTTAETAPVKPDQVQDEAPVFRRRSGPHRTQRLSAGSTTSATAATTDEPKEPTAEERMIVEALKAEVVTGPSQPPSLLVPNPAPSSSSTIPSIQFPSSSTTTGSLPLPPQPSLRTTSASPPKPRYASLSPPRQGMRIDQDESLGYGLGNGGNGGGLPCDEREASREEGETSESESRGYRDRESDRESDRNAKTWRHDGYEDDRRNRGGQSDRSRRGGDDRWRDEDIRRGPYGYDDRYASTSHRRDDDRFAQYPAHSRDPYHGNANTNNNGDRDRFGHSRRSRSPRRQTHDQRSHHRHHQPTRNDPVVSPAPWTRDDPGPDEPRSKRQKRTHTPPSLRTSERERKPNRQRSRSRTPMSEDDDRSRSVSRSPGLVKQSVLSPRSRTKMERDLREGRVHGYGSQREKEDSRFSARNAEVKKEVMKTPPRTAALGGQLNPSLPRKPEAPLGTPGGSQRRPDSRLSRTPDVARPSPRGSDSASLPNEIAPPPRGVGTGEYRSRMQPSTLDDRDRLHPYSRPTPPAHSQALPHSPSDGSEPLVPRPAYGSASSRISFPEPDSARLTTATYAPPPPPPPPAPFQPPENEPEIRPIPPPAPYHAGNRPTDPPETHSDSPFGTSPTKGQTTPIETADTPLFGPDGNFCGVRTRAGGKTDFWVEARTDSPLTTAPSTPGPGEDGSEEEHGFFGASHISEYTLQQKLGEGTFGVVYKGVRGKEGAVVTSEERENEEENWKRGLRVRKGDVVALKQIIFHNEGDGLPITSVREIRILKQLDHPNVVPVVDMALDPGDPTKFEVGRTFMVFPYMDHDLAGLLENPQVKLDIGEIKQYGKQLLEGTAYLHRNGILHRDMKAANLLINNKGVLMIADFGLARSMDSPEAEKDYTSCVVTRWYRPPELLLGERRYHYPVDMWGVGCILLEMFKRAPVFMGNSDLHQAQLIFAACGPPTDGSMPGWQLLPGVEGIDKNQQQWANGFRTIRADAAHYDTEVFGDLLDKILVLDPRRRLTAAQALDHEWFWVEPFPTEPSRMREFMSSHEYDRRKLKENQQAAFGQALPPQPMVQPRPQPMPPMGYNPNGMAQPHPPPSHGMGYPPVGAYNAPPPAYNASQGMGMGMGIGPSFAGRGPGGGNQLPPHQGYGQGAPNGYVAARQPPSTLQQNQGYGAPPPGLDYGVGGRQIQHPQLQGPSWANTTNRLAPSTLPGPPPGKVNLMDRLKNKR